MRYFYPHYMNVVFRQFGLPENLINPVTDLIENCWHLRMSAEGFNALIREHDISNLKEVLKLNQELSARLLARNQPQEEFYRKYPILHPSNFPNEHASVICGHIYDASHDSKVHLQQLKGWAKQGWYTEQIKLLIRLWNEGDHMLWWWLGMPGTVKPWEHNRKDKADVE